MEERSNAAASGSYRRGLSRALIAVPERGDDRMWPVGASVIAGTADVRDEIEAVGDCDPVELEMPLPQGTPARACMIVWEGELDEDDGGAIWRGGEYRLATLQELSLLQCGFLESSWESEQEAAQ